MKLQEIYEDTEQLNEGLIQRAIAAAALVVGSITTMGTITKPVPPVEKVNVVPSTSQSSHKNEVARRSALRTIETRKGADISKLVAAAASKYKVDPEVVKQIVTTAHKHADPVFPTAKDILAVIGVESSFNPQAVSQLKNDPARGLMQVRPGIWKLPQGALDTIDGQIKTGADILRAYYKKFKSKEAALHAYNVGETYHRRSQTDPSVGNPRYVPKIDKERALYASNTETRSTHNVSVR